MKKTIVSLSLLLTVAVSSAFATDKIKKDPGLQEVFQQEFSGAQNVSWSLQDNYQKATFVFAGHRTIAFFTEANELAGCMRDIFYDQLPITVMKAVDKRFAGADMQEVREISNSDGTSYLLTAVLSSKKYKIRVSSSGNITDIEKSAK